jgi:hypothetical protein
MTAFQSLPENQSQVNPSIDSPGDVPSLVLYGESSASVCEASLPVDQAKPPLTAKPSWSRARRRRYGRLLSWMGESVGRGCQLLRADLTSAKCGDDVFLKRDFQELRRRIERKFGYKIEYFKVQTSEGFGVYHMVWAIKCDHAVWIPQEWLASEWEKIHGARVVYIKRMKKGKQDARNVASYFVAQYLSDQRDSSGKGSIVRVSWSWSRARFAIGKAWTLFSREWRKGEHLNPFLGMTGWCMGLSRFEKFASWDRILSQGWCQVGRALFTVHDRLLNVAYSKL